MMICEWCDFAISLDREPTDNFTMINKSAFHFSCAIEKIQNKTMTDFVQQTTDSQTTVTVKKFKGSKSPRWAKPVDRCSVCNKRNDHHTIEEAQRCKSK